MRSILTVLAMLLLSSACASSPEGDVVGTWVLESVAVDGVFVAMPDAVLSGAESAPVLEIRNDDSFSLSGFCNTLAGDGTYGSRFKTENALASIARCLDEDLATFEDRLFGVISSQPKIEFGTEQAMQLQGDTATLTFRRSP